MAEYLHRAACRDIILRVVLVGTGVLDTATFQELSTHSTRIAAKKQI